MTTVFFNYNTKHLPRTCLEAVRANTGSARRRIIIVDLASGDNAAADRVFFDEARFGIVWIVIGCTLAQTTVACLLGVNASRQPRAAGST